VAFEADAATVVFFFPFLALFEFFI